MEKRQRKELDGRSVNNAQSMLPDEEANVATNIVTVQLCCYASSKIEGSIEVSLF